MRIALYQPDIAQNVGAAMRLCACFGIQLDIIEPCGFLWDEKKIRAAAMDYRNHVDITRHNDWDNFKKANKSANFILLTTKAAIPYTEHKFTKNDILIAGRESAGVPENIHNEAHARIIIPIKPALRSLNVVTATSMVLGEALRQMGRL